MGPKKSEWDPDKINFPQTKVSKMFDLYGWNKGWTRTLDYSTVIHWAGIWFSILGFRYSFIFSKCRLLIKANNNIHVVSTFLCYIYTSQNLILALAFLWV